MVDFSKLPLGTQRMAMYVSNVREFVLLEQSIIKDTAERLVDGKSFINQIVLTRSEKVYDLVNRLAKYTLKIDGEMPTVNEKRKMRVYLAWCVLNEAKNNLN